MYVLLTTVRTVQCTVVRTVVRSTVHTYILILLLLLYHIKYDAIGRSSIFNHCDNDMFTHTYRTDCHIYPPSPHQQTLL